MFVVDQPTDFWSCRIWYGMEIWAWRRFETAIRSYLWLNLIFFCFDLYTCVIKNFCKILNGLECALCLCMWCSCYSLLNQLTSKKCFFEIRCLLDYGCQKGDLLDYRSGSVSFSLWFHFFYNMFIVIIWFSREISVFSAILWWRSVLLVLFEILPSSSLRLLAILWGLYVHVLFECGTNSNQILKRWWSLYNIIKIFLQAIRKIMHLWVLVIMGK